MSRRKQIWWIVVAAAITFFFMSSLVQAYGQDNLGKKALFAQQKLVKSQNKNGTWWTFYNFDTIPENLKRENNFFVGMLIADLLQPYKNNKLIDSVIDETLKFSYQNLNPENGFLKYFKRIKAMPEDSDDTGLFWYLAQSVDTGFVLQVIDSLKKYKTNTGLYLEWLKKGGIKNMPQAGINPETVEIIPNIHVFLFLAKYDTISARELCKCLQAEGVVSNPEYWVYYYKAPWLYYLRQADMVRNNCSIKSNLPDTVKGPVSQNHYVLISKLIRDLSLNNITPGQEVEIRRILRQLSNNNFEYIKSNPILIYHSDLTSRSPAYFWSFDLPYALWLRLYYEYNSRLTKKK